MLSRSTLNTMKLSFCLDWSSPHSHNEWLRIEVLNTIIVESLKHFNTSPTTLRFVFISQIKSTVVAALNALI